MVKRMKQGCSISLQSNSGGMTKIYILQTCVNSPVQKRTKNAVGYLTSIEFAR